MDEGKFNETDLRAELAELLRGEKPGRTSDEAVTLFKSVGASLGDLAAAIATIADIGDMAALEAAVADAFDGAVLTLADGRAALEQPGMLRPMGAAELSEGTLRFLMLAAALLTPRPPELIVLNEPETSLHPSLIPPLARLMRRAARDAQLVVVTHDPALEAALREIPEAETLSLFKRLGETLAREQSGEEPHHLPVRPGWTWPKR